MKSRIGIAIAGALLCFGIGLLVGRNFFQKSSSNRTAEVRAGESLPQSSPSRANVNLPNVTTTSRGASNATSGVVAEPQTKKSATIAALQAALRATRSRWDLTKLYRVL